MNDNKRTEFLSYFVNARVLSTWMTLLRATKYKLMVLKLNEFLVAEQESRVKPEKFVLSNPKYVLSVLLSGLEHCCVVIIDVFNSYWRYGTKTLLSDTLQKTSQNN